MLPNPPAPGAGLRSSSILFSIRATCLHQIVVRQGSHYLSGGGYAGSRGARHSECGPRLIKAFPRPRLHLRKSKTRQPVNHGDTEYHL